MFYNLIASTEESTVVSEYVREARPEYGAYQSEEELETALLRLLQQEGYTYLDLHSEAELIANLRMQLEALNDYAFSDAEWDWFFQNCVAPASDGIVEKTRRIQTDEIQNLRCDDGTTKNIKLLDKTQPQRNRLQVLHQYAVPGGAGEGAVVAGADIVLVCHEYPHEEEVYLGIKDAVDAGEISEERLDASVRRIVLAKLAHAL